MKIVKYRVIFICVCCAIVIFVLMQILNLRLDDKKRLVELLSSETITVPYDKFIHLKPEENSQHKITNPKFHLIVYYDSTVCASCVLKTINEWNGSLDKARCYSTNIVFIFSVKNEDVAINDVNRYYKCSGFCQDIYLDSCEAFVNSNKAIPESPLYHTFVINKEGKVLMVGNPFQNEKMEELFKKVMAKEKREQKKKECSGIMSPHSSKRDVFLCV